MSLPSRGSQFEDGGSKEMGKNAGMAAKGMMAKGRKRKKES